MICATCGAKQAARAPETPCAVCRGAVLLADRDALAAVIGRGANGITYRAERISDGAAFAIKEIPLRTLENAKAMELFEREARVLRELDHPSVPRYEDDFVFGEGKTCALYLVQELVSGRTLAEEMAERRYDARDVLAIIASVADVLAYLHERTPPVIHRDVKPKNVMRRDDGRLVLIDFGSVRDALSRGGGSTVAGTFGYMAPEQLAGKATPASDVYGLGALAMALLTRKEPDTLLDERHFIDVREYVDAPADVLALLAQMLEPAPAKRLPRAREVAARARAIGSAVERAPDVKTKTVAATLSKREKRRRQKAEQHERLERARNERRQERDAEPGDAQAERSANRTMIVVMLVSGAVIAAIVGFCSMRSPGNAGAIASTTVGVPELYARPLAVDVNGDGVEDLVSVMGVDGGPHASEDDDDAWGKENGRFEAYVQAIDGANGQVLYALPMGKAYTSLGNEAKTSRRITLVTNDRRLGVARIPPSGAATMTIHDLATGKELGKLSLDSLTGAIHEVTRGAGPSAHSAFVFERVGGAIATEVDLLAATAKPWAPDDATSRSARGPSTANVADAPVSEITSLTRLPVRYSRDVSVAEGAFRGSTATIAASASKAARGRAVLVVSPRTSDEPEAAPGITVTTGELTGSRRDNTKTNVVGIDLPDGAKRFDRSLASLGFTREVVDRVEMLDGDRGVLLFFQGASGLALLDSSSGATRWALPLPEGARLSSYTLSATRAYLHVFGSDAAVYGYLSRKLASRILVADLTTGRWVRSVPEGPRGSPRVPSSPSRRRRRGPTRRARSHR